MHQADVTPKLFEELERLRLLPEVALLALVDAPANQRIVTVNGEEITIDVTIRWADTTRKALRIEAVANGPSTWRLERFRESLLLPTDT